jgi:hypothetical protein
MSNDILATLKYAKLDYQKFLPFFLSPSNALLANNLIVDDKSKQKLVQASDKFLSMTQQVAISFFTRNAGKGSPILRQLASDRVFCANVFLYPEKALKSADYALNKETIKKVSDMSARLHTSIEETLKKNVTSLEDLYGKIDDFGGRLDRNVWTQVGKGGDTAYILPAVMAAAAVVCAVAAVVTTVCAVYNAAQSHQASTTTATTTTTIFATLDTTGNMVTDDTSTTTTMGDNTVVSDSCPGITTIGDNTVVSDSCPGVTTMGDTPWITPRIMSEFCDYEIAAFTTSNEMSPDTAASTNDIVAETTEDRWINLRDGQFTSLTRFADLNQLETPQVGLERFVMRQILENPLSGAEQIAASLRQLGASKTTKASINQVLSKYGLKSDIARIQFAQKLKETGALTIGPAIRIGGAVRERKMETDQR